KAEIYTAKKTSSTTLDKKPLTPPAYVRLARTTPRSLRDSGGPEEIRLGEAGGPLRDDVGDGAGADADGVGGGDYGESDRPPESVGQIC
ncbi:hypothetical protein B8W95_13290, partial [Staphylococcus pasteuri]